MGIKRALKEMYLAAYDTCYAEANAGSLETGKKYHLPAVGDGPSQQVFVDSSGEDKIKIFICENEVLRHKITVTGSKEGKTKGSYVSIEDGSESKTEFTGTFDNEFSKAGQVKSSASFLEASGDDGTWYDAVFDFKKSAISNARYAIVVKDGAESTRLVDAGAMLVGTNAGTGIVYYDENTNDDDANPAGAYQAWFDAAGLELAPDATVYFEEDGELTSALSDLPSLPDTTASPASFSDDDWDCSGTEEADLSAVDDGVYEACDALLAKIKDEDCSADTYAEDLAEELDLSTFDIDADRD